MLKTSVWFRNISLRPVPGSWYRLAIVLSPCILLALPSDMGQPFGDLYRGSVFTLIRYFYDLSLGRLPFPAFYWLLAGWVLFLILPIMHRTSSMRDKIKGALFRILIVIASFYWLWGFNYLAILPQEKLSLKRTKIPLERLEIAFCRELDLMRISRPDSFYFDKIELENEVRNNVSLVFKDIGLPAPGMPRVRVLKPNGVLLRLATAGVYMPYVFEGHIDGGLHPSIQGFTMAHEMTHAYGVGHEGSCNFIAYLAGLRSSDPLLSYSAHLSYWRYLAREIKFLSPDDFKRLWLELDENILNDIREINEYYDRYPDLFPLARSVIYDQYLKFQGMEEGLGTYLQIVSWVETWYDRRM